MKKLKLFFAACALLLGTAATWAQDAGTYYIQNVSNGKWLSPGNSWGTQASVLNHGEYWKLAKVSEGVYTLESVVSNGGSNYYLTGEWCDGAATNFTFAAVAGKENTYTIAKGSDGLLTTNGTTVNVSGSDVAAAVSQWKLVTEAEMAATLAAATVDNPADATFLITDHTFGRNNRYVNSWTNDGNCALSGGNSNKHCAEKYHGVYNVYQKLSNAPVGCYKLTAQGFYRQDGEDNTNLPVIYANTTTATFPLKTGSENSMADACTSFEAGKYAIDPIYVYVDAEGELTVGTKLETNTTLWCIWDNFELTYYGDHTVAEVLLADYVKAYNEAMGEATSFTEESMWADAWTTLQIAISANTLDLNNVTKEQLETATANLKAANSVAAAAVKAKTIYESAVALINGGTNVDLTSLVVNAGFEEGNLNGWTSVDGGGVANNNNWPKKVDSYFVERWRSNGDTQNHLSDGTLTHDALVLPAGLYTITANAQNQEQKNGVAGTGYFLYANNEKVEISASNTYSTNVLLEEDKSELIIKFALEGCTGNWISCDDVHLTYVGEDFPAYTLVTGKMKAEVAAAQTAADEAFQANKTITNYNALTAAIAAAQVSKDAYASAKTAIDAAEDLQTKNIFVTSEAATTFAEAIAAIKDLYDNSTLADDAAANAGKTLGVVAVGWHAAATNTPASNYIGSTWGGQYTINDWSVEGESDGSNYLVPFFQNWTNDDKSLGTTTMTGTLTGLENGLYEVSAWVRVRAKNETAATDATGITLQVTTGDEVDVTEGSQVGTTQFQLNTYTAQGLVKDGTLTVNFNIADGNNVSWLSFKDIKYTKLRDLTPEEEFVPATTEDYAALNNAIGAAEAKTLGFEEAEYAPYNNIEALATLAAAKAINQEAENEQKDVQAATTALTGATWTANASEVNAFYKGDFDGYAEDTTTPLDYTPNGWTATANFRMMLKNAENYPGLSDASAGAAVMSWSGGITYGEQAGYEMPLAAHTIYELTFKAASWNNEDKGDITVSVLNETDGMAAINLGKEDKDIVGKQGNPSGMTSFSIVFVTGKAGNYIFHIGSNKNMVLTDFNLVKAASQVLEFADGSVPTYAPGTYPSVKITRTLNAGKWATAVYPFAVSGVDNIAVLDSYDKATGTLGFTSAVASTANEPFLMRSTAGTSEISLSNVEVAAANATDATKSEASLKGVYSSTDITNAEKNFVLSNNQIFSVGEAGATISPYRAYIQIEQDAVNPARGINFVVDGQITGVEGVAAASETVVKEGKFVEKGQIVIYRNGKKFNATGAQMK